jgi:predicted anti-sigma-YlaC factor YlaD
MVRGEEMSGVKGCEHSEQMTALMSLALDGLLDAGDQQRLQKHLAACSGCRVTWEAMRQVSALFEQSPMVGPPLGFAVRVERRLAEKAKRRRHVFGGVAVLTSSLSLAGITVAAVLMVVLGVVAWHWLGSLSTVLQGTSAVSQVASSLGLLGKGASFFLGDLLLHYGAPLVILLVIGLFLLIGLWIWLFVKRPGGFHHNGCL